MNWFAMLIKLLALLVPMFKQYAQTTANLLDDIGARVAELVATDETLQKLIEAWIETKTTETGPQIMSACVSVEATEAMVMADPQLTAIARHIAEKLNLDWAKLMEFLMKILPLILPILI
jgi:malate synthase